MTIARSCEKFKPIWSELDPVDRSLMKIMIGNFFPYIIILLKDCDFVSKAANSYQIAVSNVCPCYAPNGAFISTLLNSYALNSLVL